MARDLQIFHVTDRFGLTLLDSYEDFRQLSGLA